MTLIKQHNKDTYTSMHGKDPAGLGVSNAADRLVIEQAQKWKRNDTSSVSLTSTAALTKGHKTVIMIYVGSDGAYYGAVDPNDNIIQWNFDLAKCQAAYDRINSDDIIIGVLAGNGVGALNYDVQYIKPASESVPDFIDSIQPVNSDWRTKYPTNSPQPEFPDDVDLYLQDLERLIDSGGKNYTRVFILKANGASNSFYYDANNYGKYIGMEGIYGQLGSTYPGEFLVSGDHWLLGLRDILQLLYNIDQGYEVMAIGDVSDKAYDSTWNGQTTTAPSQNAVYDKIETMISDTAYGVSWNGVTDVAGSKNAVYDKIESFKDTTSGSAGCTLVGIPAIGTPTWTTLCHALNLINSSGRATGGAVTDAGGETVDTAAGTGFIKATDSDTAEILSMDWSASSGDAIATDTRKYVGIIYDSGTPSVEIRAAEDYDLDTEFGLASVVNEAGTLHILNNPWWTTDGITNIIERFDADGYIVRDNKVGGLILSVPGTRNIAVTAGKLWSRLNEFDIASIDTSVAGTVETYWTNSADVWTGADVTQYPVLQWNDVTLDALQNIPANKYCNWWVYAEADDTEIALVYPQAYYNTAAGAELESPPTEIPPHISAHGILIGRIIFKQGVDAPIAVESSFDTTFVPAAAADHANLVNLGWSVANHTIDTDIDMSSNSLTNLAGFSNGGSAVECTDDLKIHDNALIIDNTSNPLLRYEEAGTEKAQMYYDTGNNWYAFQTVDASGPTLTTRWSLGGEADTVDMIFSTVDNVDFNGADLKDVDAVYGFGSALDLWGDPDTATKYLQIARDTGGAQNTHFFYGANDDIYLSYGTSGSIFMRSGGSTEWTLDGSGNVTMSGNLSGVGEGTFTTVSTANLDNDGGTLAINDAVDMTDNAISNCGQIEMNAGQKIISESFLYLQSAATQNMLMDCGGYFYWRDIDDSNAIRLTLNSADGNITTTGKLGVARTPTTHMIELAAQSDDLGFILYGYDDQSAEWLKFTMGSAGYAAIDASLGYRYRQGGTNLAFINATATNGFRMYDDMAMSFGTTAATRFTMGYASGTGKLQIGYNGAFNTAAAVFSMGTDGSITLFDGASLNLQEDITYTGATTENKLLFPDALADALTIGEGANSYLTFTSSNGSEKITANKDLHLPDLVSIVFGTGGDATLNYDSNDLVLNPDAVGSGEFRINGQTDVNGVLQLQGTMYIKENAAAGADVAGYGQLYCKDNSGTTELWFVDDSGTETQLA